MRSNRSRSSKTRKKNRKKTKQKKKKAEKKTPITIRIFLSIFRWKEILVAFCLRFFEVILFLTFMIWNGHLGDIRLKWQILHEFLLPWLNFSFVIFCNSELTDLKHNFWSLKSWIKDVLLLKNTKKILLLKKKRKIVTAFVLKTVNL